MQNTIYKYQLNIGRNQVSMPSNARLLSAGIQRSNFMLWALVDTERPIARRVVHVVGTGCPIDGVVLEKGSFVATIFEDVGGNVDVWHVFDVGWMT
jgi:hypothetical protein